MASIKISDTFRTLSLSAYSQSMRRVFIGMHLECYSKFEYERKDASLTLIKVQIQEFQSWKRILFCHVNSARALHFWSLFIIWLFSFFVLQLNGDCSNGSSIESDESSPSSVASPLTGNTSGGSEVATMTEPESLGNCEPGTAVKLQGIVWQETDKGGKFFKHQLFSLPKTPSYKIMRHF